MQYIATIFYDNGAKSAAFQSTQQAAEWIDSENNNHEFTSMIETYDDKGQKKDGFFYTEKSR